MLHTVCPHKNAISRFLSIQILQIMLSSISVSRRCSVEFCESLDVFGNSLPNICFPSAIKGKIPYQLQLEMAVNKAY